MAAISEPAPHAPFGGVVDTHVLPKKVHWGRPVSEALGDVMTELGAKRAFLMVSSTLRHESAFVDDVVAALGERCVGVWDGMLPHTPREGVIAAAAAARAVDADVIVTIGGGSLTDGAKVVRVALAENVTSVEDLDGYKYTPGDEKLGNPLRMTPLIPQVTIPTTLSAGEFSFFAGCTNTAAKAERGKAAKEIYLYPAALPSAIILDPAAAQYTPPWLLLSTGIRSVDHCVEALCSPSGNPYSDSMLKAALKLLVRGLRRAHKDPEDKAALLDCQIGIFQTVQGCQSGPAMGASHAIGHILGGSFDVPHGYTSCVALPAVLAWNAAAPGGHPRQRLVSEVFEELALEDGGPDAVAQLAGISASDHVRGLVRELGLPETLRDVGVSSDQLDDAAERTMQDRLVATNPRPIADWRDVRAILDLALE